jgi:hypothetical protein
LTYGQFDTSLGCPFSPERMNWQPSCFPRGAPRPSGELNAFDGQFLRFPIGYDFIALVFDGWARFAVSTQKGIEEKS